MCSFALTKHLPGDDVGVVFQGRYDDVITLADAVLAKGEGKGVDRISSAFGEDYLIGRTCPYEGSHFGSGSLVLFGSHLTQVMHTSVDVGIEMLVGIDNSLQHPAWFLARGSIVQIDQGLAIDCFVEYREIVAVHIVLGFIV